MINVFLFTFLLLLFSSRPLYAGCEPWCNRVSCTPWDDCNDCNECLQYAPTPVGQKSLGSLEGIGPLGNFIKSMQGIETPISLLNRVISIGIGLITLFAFLYFILQFFTAALKWITAGGDQKSVEAAGKQITNALIGLVIVVSATFIIELVGMVLRIELLNPFDFLKNIWKP